MFRSWLRHRRRKTISAAVIDVVGAAAREVEYLAGDVHHTLAEVSRKERLELDLRANEVSSELRREAGAGEQSGSPRRAIPKGRHKRVSDQPE
jgi:hypothetical protein